MAQKDIINPGMPGFDRYTFSPGVARQGKLFFVSGQTGTNDYGQVVSDDFCDQTYAALEKIRLILESGGASFADVVKSVDYISTDTGYRDTARVRREVWGRDYPAATGVIITQMLRKIPKIEVDCTAIIPETPADTFARHIVGTHLPRYQEWTFAPGVIRKGNILCIAGQTATDADGNLVAPDDIVAQTRQALSNIQRIVEAAGGSIDDVVKTTDFVTTTQRYKDTAEVRRAFWKNGFPAATGIVVEQLRPVQALIEVSAIAVLPTSAREDRRIDLPHPGAAGTACAAAATRGGKVLFLSGTTGTDDKGNVLYPGDITGQAAIVYDKHRQVLEAAGACWDNVIQATDYVVGMAQYDAVNAHRQALFGDRVPAVTPVGVKALLRPGALIEVDLIAVLD
jgi:enamine deaminase RidA (YjgF/YER057c/UK114 family)